MCNLPSRVSYRSTFMVLPVIRAETVNGSSTRILGKDLRLSHSDGLIARVTNESFPMTNDRSMHQLGIYSLATIARLTRDFRSTFDRY